MTLQLDTTPTAAGPVEDRIDRWRDLDLEPLDPVPTLPRTAPAITSSTPGAPSTSVTGSAATSATTGELEAAGFTLARLAVTTVAAIIAARVTGLPLAAGWVLLTVATAWALRPVATVRTALAGAVTAWLLGTGFLADRLGVLAFGAADQARFAVLILVAFAVVLVGRLVAASRRTP